MIDHLVLGSIVGSTFNSHGGWIDAQCCLFQLISALLGLSCIFLTIFFLSFIPFFFFLVAHLFEKTKNAKFTTRFYNILTVSLYVSIGSTSPSLG